MTVQWLKIEILIVRLLAMICAVGWIGALRVYNNVLWTGPALITLIQLFCLVRDIVFWNRPIAGERPQGT